MRTLRARRTFLVGTAIAVPTLTLLTVATFSVLHLLGPQPRERGPATLLSPEPERTYSAAPQDEVRDVHRALHRIGDACTDPGPDTTDVVGQQVSVILDFVRRHPGARFEIDDESGTPLALLLVLQDELAPCAPTEVPRVQNLLPPDLRQASRATA